MADDLNLAHMVCLKVEKSDWHYEHVSIAEQRTVFTSSLLICDVFLQGFFIS